MRLAFVGKGGSGKTRISALLARGLARQGWSVVALDCDANPNLAPIDLVPGSPAVQAVAGLARRLARMTRDPEAVEAWLGQVGR